MVREIDSRDLQARIAAGEVIHLLDIRTQGELAAGILPEAKHLPMHLIPLRMHEFPAEGEVVLYCRSGARSHHACAYLMQRGVRNVVNLRGGIVGWAGSGLPVEQRLAG